MEILAENRFAMTKSLFIEGRLALSKESYGKAANKIAAALLILLFALAAGSLLLGLSVASVGMEVVILGVMAFWLLFGLPRSNAKEAYKALTKKCGDEPERVTRFFSDQLEIEGPGVHTVLAYTRIEQVLRTRHLLILVSDEKAGVLLKLDGFTVGGEAEVCGLISAGKA